MEEAKSKIITESDGGDKEEEKRGRCYIDTAAKSQDH